MPVVGEEESRSEVGNDNGIATQEAERGLQTVAERNVPLVEGAHSDAEQKSHRSDSDEGSGKGGNKRLPPLLGDFDVLRFKNRFLEVIEELRMRRVIDAENEERIKTLVTEKHDLQQKLEEAHANCEVVIEGHIHDELELRKNHKEQLKQAEDEVTRNKLVAESKELELKAVKDEIRSLYMSRYNLEKKVQEQERQLHLQSSSKENYLSQVNQLEQNCLSVSQQASEVNEHLERLQANVKAAMELHKKLEYVNEHQKCELKQYQGQLEQCRRELLEARVKVNSDRETLQSGGENKCKSHELRMQIELNHQLQDQLSALREEHQGMILQLKEAHSVLNRHIESSAKLSANEMIMEEELREVKESNQDLQQKLTSAEQIYKTAVEKHCKEIAEANEKCSDLEQRLKALQSDYAALQVSHEKLEEEKLADGTEIKAMKEYLNTLKDKLKKADKEMKSLCEDNESMQGELKHIKLSLNHNNIPLVARVEFQNENDFTELQPRVSVPLASPCTTVKLEDSGEIPNESAAGTIKAAKSVIPNLPTLSPVFSPEIILISPPSPLAVSKSNNLESPCKEDTEDVNSVSVPTCEVHYQDLVAEPMQELVQDNDCPLAEVGVDSSNHKRTASCGEGLELVSPPGKRLRLEDTAACDSSGGHSEAISKVADSPVPEKNEPMTNKEVCIDNTAGNNEPTKLENIKQECIKIEKGEEDQARLSQTSEDKEKHNSQENTGIGNQAKVPEVKDNKQDDANLQIVFSDEEDEGGANGSHMIGGRMMSSQMNRQIDRVQVFLKLERLRRPKK